ncbi:MAG: alpha/beta hydrolase-fold protein [Woeseiaceae bacterium]|nr:alpha/beta hydrolase-fold protein [Woeseiaceae bacterium]
MSVYAPHTYDPKESYPLLVVLDADPLLGLLKTLNFLWVEEGKSVPVILVGIPFGASANAIWTNRSHYLLPRPVEAVNYYGNVVTLNSGGGASELARFIHDELLPTVLDRYSVDPNRSGLAGFSMGGLFAAWHFVMYPEIFSDYLIIAPPLAPPFVGSNFGDATKKLKQRGLNRPTRLYVAHAENDLEYVLTGASRWASGWQEHEDANLTFRSELIEDHYHDSGAIPALINGYEFLYGR